MTENQFELFLQYLDARIDEKISDAFGLDGLSEVVRANELKKELMDALNLSIV